MKKIITIKKLILLIVNVAFAVILMCTHLFAKNHVDNMEVDVAINKNGSATITQRWIGDFDEGTEVFIPIQDKSLIINNFKVKKGDREYLSTDGWNVDWTFEQKKWRSGINRTSDGIELCFGISSYGNNIYTFSYDVDPLVKSYDDADGFNFKFINDSLSVFPSNATLRIRMADGQKLNTDNARIWGFGYDGAALFSEDGYAVAFTNSTLSGKNHMTITLQIFKGMLLPNVSEKGTFEELVLNRALEGSNYTNTSSSINLTPYLIGLIAFIFVAKSFIRKKQLKKFYKDVNYFRDNPNGGNIEKTYVLFKDFNLWTNSATNVIGAIIMKMINDGNLKTIQETSYGFFGKENVNTSLKVGSEPADPIAKRLYEIIVKAAGEDGVLQEKELKNYASKNYEILNDYIKFLEATGHNKLHQENCYLKINGKNLKDLTENGKNQLSEVYGLRKFLDEFTLISERSVNEGVIWENLIVYATLFGIAKKVLSELKELYPDKLVEIEKMSNTYYVSNVYYRSLYYSSLNARRAAEAAKGLGGAASLGGGGGASGGGSGGGTR